MIDAAGGKHAMTATVPTQLKVLRGNPGKRPINRAEPKPSAPRGLPSAPRGLDKVGRRAWRRVGAELHQLGLLTAIDLDAFEMYCRAVSRYFAAEVLIEQKGMVIKTRTGYSQPNPAIGIQNRALGTIHRLSLQFGLTPAARVHLQIVNSKTADDDIRKFLFHSGQRAESAG